MSSRGVAVLDVQSPTEGPSLHIIGVGSGIPQLRHTIRYASGKWQTSFGSLGDGVYTDAACAGVGSDVHVAAVADGQLWHTVRYPDGKWQGPLARVRDSVPIGNPGQFSAVACAGVGGDVHLVGLAGGRLYHTIGYADGTWQQEFGTVQDVVRTGDPGQFSAVACAGVGGDLHVVGLAGGKLYHTVRFPNGKWQPYFGRVQDTVRSGDPGEFSAVACGGVGSDLHLTGIAGGRLYHTIRFASEKWQSYFGRPQDAVSGDPGQFSAAGCAGVGSDLHLTGIAGGRLYHTIRHANEKWEAFGQVQDQVSGAGNWFSRVSLAGQAGTAVQLLVDGRAYFTKLKELLYKLVAGPSATYPMAVPFPVTGDPTIENVLVGAGAAGRHIDVAIWDPGIVFGLVAEGKAFRSVFSGTFPMARRFKTRLDARAGEHRGNVRVYLEPYVARTSPLPWLPTGLVVTSSAQHQKLALFSFAGRKYALVGGLNVGDVDWDDAEHPVDPNNPSQRPRHDIAVLVDGAAAGAVERELDRRWKKSQADPIADPSGYYAKLGFWNMNPEMCLDSCPRRGVVRAPAGAISADPTTTVGSDCAIKLTVVRTNSERSASSPVTEIRDALLARVAEAESYVYIEGFTFHYTELVLALQSRLSFRPGLSVMVVLPDYGHSGWAGADMLERGESYWSRCAYHVLALPFADAVELTDQSIVRARDWPAVWRVDAAAELGPLEFWTFTYGKSATDTRTVPIDRVRRIVSSTRKIYLCAPYRRTGGALRSIYVHAKVAIIDDRSAFVGSANFNRRSMTSDGELSVLFEGSPVVPRIRTPLFTHWGLTDATTWKERLDAAAASSADGLALLRLDTATMFDRSPTADSALGYFGEVLTSAN